MQKLDFINHLKEIVKLDPIPFKEDKPRIRQMFIDLKDSYQRDNIITIKQNQNWCLTTGELNKLLKIAKG